MKEPKCGVCGKSKKELISLKQGSRLMCKECAPDEYLSKFEDNKNTKKVPKRVNPRKSVIDYMLGEKE